MLWTVTKFLETLLEIQLFVELGGYTNQSSFFRFLRSHIVLKADKDIIVIELELDHNRLIEKCMETALRAWYYILREESSHAQTLLYLISIS